MAAVTVDSLFGHKELRDELARFGRIKSIKKEAKLVETGDPIQFVPIVLKGVLRVVRENKEGNEVFLYHLYPGQTCAMAINCCQTHANSMVNVIAEDESEVLMVPVRQISDWMRFKEWKEYVAGTYSLRFSELLQVIDLIAFSNMDQQVLHYLKERCKAANTSTLFITHQQIADEMHTHREAVSRLLRTMERKNLVRLGRNTIEIL